MTKLPCVWILHFMFHRSKSINNKQNNKQPIRFLFIYFCQSPWETKKEQLALGIESFAVFALKDTQIHRKFYHLWLNIFQTPSNKTPAKREPFPSSHPVSVYIEFDRHVIVFPRLFLAFFWKLKAWAMGLTLYFLWFTVWSIDLDFRAAWNSFSKPKNQGHPIVQNHLNIALLKVFLVSI